MSLPGDQWQTMANQAQDDVNKFSTIDDPIAQQVAISRQIDVGIFQEAGRLADNEKRLTDGTYTPTGQTSTVTDDDTDTGGRFSSVILWAMVVAVPLGIMLFQFAKDVSNLPFHAALFNLNKYAGKSYYHAYVPKPWDQWKISDNSAYDKEAGAGRKVRAQNSPQFAYAPMSNYVVLEPPRINSRSTSMNVDYYYSGALALDCIRKAYDECLPVIDPDSEAKAIPFAVDFLSALAKKGDVQAALDLGLLYLQPWDRGGFRPKDAITAYRYAASQFPGHGKEFARRAELIEAHTRFLFQK